ncbi:porin family protein [Arsenicitalea aurantiaca]|uniref:Porin family protein n=1 Tax=Arsenicitalea aurantiaca TaxID=1783274 RepID=A0A433XFB0_9HYPH|nr:outer membrane beta-barrel protein [Arsenicitalea aurantiaca]RUT32694.1 porin family protein [Arsenicitalea aurantiaca]
MARLSRSIPYGVLLALATSAGVQAANIGLPVASSAYEVPVHDAAAPFDWSGFYAGVYGVVGTSSESDEASFGAGVALGANAQYDFVLVGGEVAFHGLTGDTDATYLQALLRGGVLVTDTLGVYAAAGYGIDLGEGADNDLLLGGGLEFAVTDSVSLNAQYLRQFDTGDAPAADQVTFGARFHF